MPKPAYILCAEKVIQDKYTNLVTVCDILERIVLCVKKSDGVGLDSKLSLGSELRFVAIACWSKEPEDENQEFEVSFSVSIPGSENRFESKAPPFKFPPGITLHRTIFRCHFVPESRETSSENIHPGQMIVKGTVRRVGSEEQISQEFSIDVDVKKVKLE